MERKGPRCRPKETAKYCSIRRTGMRKSAPPHALRRIPSPSRLTIALNGNYCI